MIDDIKKEAGAQMKRAVEVLATELQKIRTGRAHPSLLDHIHVNYYGSHVPLKQVASVSAEDARTLLVQPWDKGAVTLVEKALRESELGLNPNTAGMSIRVPMPPLTEERRRDLLKVVRHEAELARVAVRNARRDANKDLEAMVKEKLISEDEERRGHEGVQKLTDQYIKDIDEVLAKKEQDMMAV
jgi:ribosome recycling factor